MQQSEINLTHNHSKKEAMEGTYEYELERAELLGIEPISKDKWEEQNKERLEAEVEQEQSEIAQKLESEDETLKGAHGKMGELNSILSATQQKLNKFKVTNLMLSCAKIFCKQRNKFQTVCGSFTSLLKMSSRSASPAPGDHASSSTGETSKNSINDALDNLDQMKEVQQQSNMEFMKQQVEGINHKTEKNLDALDRLLSKTESAELTLQHQNQQIKSYLRK